MSRIERDVIRQPDGAIDGCKNTKSGQTRRQSDRLTSRQKGKHEIGAVSGQHTAGPTFFRRAVCVRDAGRAGPAGLG